MYSVFFHLLGLSLIEIIFYFYYIGPFEHDVFVATFGKSMGGLVGKMDSYEEHPYINFNLTNFTLINDNFLSNLKEESNTANIKRETQNYELFRETIHTWLLCVAVIGGILILHMLYKYLKKKNIINTSGNDQHIELINLTNEQDTILEHTNSDHPRSDHPSSTIQPESPIHTESTFHKVFNYILFSGLLLTFEYLFFHYIILKYHIITDVQIQYLVYSQIYEYTTNKYLLN